MMKNTALPLAIMQVLQLVGDESSHVFVENVADADLVVFTEVRDIERGFSREKTYVYFDLKTGLRGAKEAKLPENCVTIDQSNTLIGLTQVIASLRQKLTSTVEIAPAPVEEVVPLRPDALRILVIDDTPGNITSAKQGLAGHRLTTVTGYEDAMDILNKENFDVVLTDLHLPMSSKTMGDKFKLGELVPYGLLLMVEAAHQGATRVAVVTNLSHHDDPFSAAFDHFSRFPVNIDGAIVLMTHAPMKGGAKDWAMALDWLMKG